MKFLLTVFPGLAGLAKDELQAKLKLAPVASGRVRGSELLWVQTSDPAGLLELRLVEDVFVSIDTIKLSGGPSDMRVLSRVSSGEAVGAALRVYEHLTGLQVPARSNYRVVVQADDAPWRSYRRIDMQEAVETGIRRGRPKWQLADVAPVEVWLHQDAKSLAVSLRISNWKHRARGGREVERAAALRPTIAAAMVFAAGSGDDDVFLDPMCGSGTILLERAQAGRYGLLLGGDIDPGAVKATQANFGPRHQPRRLIRMDARHLPLEDGSIDKFVTNLPWGHQVGTKQELPALYGAVLGEAVRVVRPGGTIVLLSSEYRLLAQVIRMSGAVTLKCRFKNIEVLGRPAEMVVLSR
jgi:tRNA (guanine6-N2)-methyltransferase